jgi:Fe/S biogenesis protein NfuA
VPVEHNEEAASTATLTEDAPSEMPVLTVTAAAMEVVRGVLSSEPNPDELGLRVEITGTQGSEYTYDLSFEELANAAADDHRSEQDELSIMVPAATVADLTGAVLDTPAAGSAGLVIRNPNRPDPLAGVDLDRSGDLASQVTQLLEQAINPSLAAHGGFATLVGVDDDNKVYLSLGGGCQGCSMSRMTITQGIQAQLSEAIPEVSEVIDVTDHASGENPFY